MLEVRNGFAAFEQSRSLLEARDLEARGKKMRLQLVLFALTRAQERTTVPHYAKVLSLVKKGKVFGQAFFKRLVGVWGQSPRNTTCAPLLDVRSEKLEVRNGFAAFEQSRSLLEARDLEARGKKMRLQLVLFALTRAQERTTVPHYAKVLSLVKKGKVFDRPFCKRVVKVVAYACIRR